MYWNFEKMKMTEIFRGPRLKSMLCRYCRWQTKSWSNNSFPLEGRLNMICIKYDELLSYIYHHQPIKAIPHYLINCPSHSLPPDTHPHYRGGFCLLSFIHGGISKASFSILCCSQIIIEQGKVTDISMPIHQKKCIFLVNLKGQGGDESAVELWIIF